jgi:hypothetical protein
LAPCAPPKKSRRAIPAALSGLLLLLACGGGTDVPLDTIGPQQVVGSWTFSRTASGCVPEAITLSITREAASDGSSLGFEGAWSQAGSTGTTPLTGSVHRADGSGLHVVLSTTRLLHGSLNAAGSASVEFQDSVTRCFGPMRGTKTS